jgi:hypothetical protein
VRTGEVPRRPPPPPRTPAPAPPRTRQPTRSRRGLLGLLAVFLVIVAGVVAAFVIAAGGAGTRPVRIQEERLDRQVDQLRDFVRENAR